jgi:hypothetical protein
VRVRVHLLGGCVVHVLVLMGFAVVGVRVAVLHVLVVVLAVLVGVRGVAMGVLVGVDLGHGRPPRKSNSDPEIVYPEYGPRERGKPFEN